MLADALALDPEEVQRLRRDMPDHSFAREYLCDFCAAGDDQLISLMDAEEASKRVYMPRDVEGAPRIGEVEFTPRSGDTETVVIRVRGPTKTDKK